MKAVSLLLRLLTLAVIIAIGIVWFLNKDELTAINEAYESAQTQLNMPEQPLSDVITKGMNDLSDTRKTLREFQARAASLDQQLTSTRDTLVQTEDQLRSTNQELRNTRRDLESTERDLVASRETADQLTAEMQTVRNDLIRVNREKFELNQKIESTEEEKRALAQRVEQLEGSTGSVVAATPRSNGEEDQNNEIIRLRAQLEAAQAEIERIAGNPLGAALASTGGGDQTLSSSQVRVKALNLDRGLVVLTPSSSDEFIGVSTLTVNRDGSPIANLRLRGVYPDYLVAEILPTSTFIDALETGSVYTYR